ncbi:hypothetical protein EB796_012310 [Bugula neritina]|uniref:Core domain-containing protein n=1 Tax=Bugula neritina TaxID=10212 RepID=A0A7J7JUL5_BUGNE|nr:hypothetical protein EB796_012310 [Bugula neritina]
MSLRKLFNISPFTYQNISWSGRFSAVAPMLRCYSHQPPSPDTILVNERAVQQMQKVCADGGSLRITVEGGGCSGFQYLFSLEDPGATAQDDDICIVYQKTQVLVDSDSMEFIKGATLDYNTELIKSAFRIIDNPKARLVAPVAALLLPKISHSRWQFPSFFVRTTN